MNNPAILVVPALMLLDYVLTILGAKAASGVYRQHIKSPHYELNPIWQKSVEQLRWFNLRHFSIVCVVALLLFLLDRMSDFPAEYLRLIVGAVVGGTGVICGRHLTNLLLFRYLNRNPTEINGRVEFTHQLLLKISLFNYVGLVPVFGLIVVLVPDPSTMGALLGLLSLAIVHLIWIHKATAQEAKSRKPEIERASTEAEPNATVDQTVENFKGR